MIAIWKFPITITENQIVPMPIGARILTVQVQGGKPCLWAVVDTEARQVPRLVLTMATGEDLDPAWKRVYIGTYQLPNGEVYHVFA